MTYVFQGDVLAQTVGVAVQHKIEPEALLAVVQVESAGKALENDGRTPCLLFERHIFYRELKKAGKTVQLLNAISLGLANETWQPKTQYKDQGTSSARLALFAKACVVNEECAIRSCSWGVGQTMGFLAEELKFTSAKAMLAYLVQGGVPAQVDCMVREIENHKLTAKLNAHNWAGFAKVYNGPGYATNHYDTKMAAAWTAWKKAGIPSAMPVVQVRVTPAVQPSGPVTPAKALTATSTVTASTGIAASAVAAAVASRNQIDIRLIGFAGFIVTRSRSPRPEQRRWPRPKLSRPTSSFWM